MCYDISIYYDPEILEKRFKAHLDPVLGHNKDYPRHYHANGYDHPNIPVITAQEPEKIQFFSWGLVPWWVKDPSEAARISNQTLNAKGETVFEKPAFKDSIMDNRCLVLVNGFFEHHHHNGRTYPYFVGLKEHNPFALAGIWSKWRRSEGMDRRTFSIITTDGNPLLAEIHNNPKLEGPRMPVILPRESEISWIGEGIDPQEIKDLIKPFDDEELTAYTVPRLRGKEYTGNLPEILEKKVYPELDSQQGSLF